MPKKFYITTAIDYTNARPHLGHAYEKVLADALARWHRLKGEDVFFLTGTDEHGQKVEQAAGKAGKSPKAFVDELADSFRDLLKKLNISNDDFIRTTEERHKKVCREIWENADRKGEIYRGNYEGLYCTGCEAFYTEKDAVEGKCPIHQRALELVKEESYFFKLSKYQKKIIEHIRKNKEFILPEFRQSEVLNRLKEELKDLSVSRTSFKWGIPLPADKNHVIYVWFDALVNYISALGYPDDKKYKKFWPADVHIIGKDIMWFHAVIWPAILMSAGVSLPKTVLTHGFINIGGEKMSKSRGIVVDPIKIAEEYGTDQFRYFLVKEIATGQDGDFSEELLAEKINSDLADDLGNLLMRVLVLIEKFFDGKIPKQETLESADKKFIGKSGIADEVDNLMLNFETHRALEKIMAFARECNKYLNETEPWKKENESRRQTVLYNLAESLRIIGTLLLPFIPETAGKILAQIGQEKGSLKDAKFKNNTAGKISKGKILFPKVELKKEDPVQKLDLRIAKVLSVEDHPQADKLYVLKVDLGTEKRQLVAGLRDNLKKEEIKGKNIVVVANLKPAKLKGIESNGMLLAAEKNGVVRLLLAEKSKPGDSAYVLEPKPEKQVTIEEFAKIKFEVKNGKVLYNEIPLRTGKEEIKIEIGDGAVVR